MTDLARWLTKKIIQILFPDNEVFCVICVIVHVYVAMIKFFFFLMDMGWSPSGNTSVDYKYAIIKIGERR